MDLAVEDDQISAQLEMMEASAEEPEESEPAASGAPAAGGATPPTAKSDAASAAKSDAQPTALLDLVEEDENGDDDEISLIETALAPNLRPVVRRCDEVLGEVDAAVQVSGISSDQRRALGRVEGGDEGAPPRTDIVQDPIKLEVEEHEVPDDAVWTPPVTAEVTSPSRPTAVTTPRAASGSRPAVAALSAGDYGKPYKTTSSDRRSRVLISPSAAAAMARGSPGRGRPRGRPPSAGRGLPGRGALRVALPSTVVRGRGGVAVRSRGEAALRGRGSVVVRGRGALALRGRGAVVVRGRGGTAVRGRGRPPSTHLYAGRLPLDPIFVVQLAECVVEVVRDKLMIRHTTDNEGSPPLTQADLSFMDLVKIKEAVTKLVEKVNLVGPEDHVPRLRVARRQSISWVEARLKMDADVDQPGTPTHGKMGKSKYNLEERTPPTVARATPAGRGGVAAVPPRTTPAAPAGRGGGVAAAPRTTPAAPAGRGGGTATPAAAAAKPAGLTGARMATLEGELPVFVDDADDPDFDPEAEEDFDNERARKIAAASRPPTIAPRPSPVIGIAHKAPEPARMVQANLKNPKTSRDIVILQAKLRDLQNVGLELRRAVDYFNLEAQKDRVKVERFKMELNAMEKKKKEMENNIFTNAHPIMIGLLDKEKRKLLTGEDDAVVECGELLAEVGRENYNFVMNKGLPLLTAKELEDKTRGVTMHWSLDPLELSLAATPLETPTPRGGGRGRGRGGGRGRGRGRGLKRPLSSDTGAAVDAAVADVVSDPAPAAPQQSVAADGPEHISLPPEVLEQVMNGKGYLVDENGERLEIRMVGDAPVISTGK